MPDLDVLFAGVAVGDFDAALAWYAQLFGREADVMAHETEAMWRCTEAGWLYVVRDEDRAGRSLVTMAVSDLDRVVADISSRGITGSPIEPVGDAGRKARLRDPDGNEVSFVQVTASSAST
jgi:predicted enzyme related to lactoylglutathione lyase